MALRQDANSVTLSDQTGMSELRFAVMPHHARYRSVLTISCWYERGSRHGGGWHAAASMILSPDHARDMLLKLRSRAGSFHSIHGDLQSYGHVEYELSANDHLFWVFTANSTRAFRRYRLGSVDNAATIADKLLEALEAATSAADAPQPAKAPTPEPTPAPAPEPTPAPAPEPTPAAPVPPSSINDGRRIRELEAEVLQLRQQVHERDQMIAFLRQRGA